MGKRPFTTILCWLGLIAIVACTTPTIPIPPPSVERASFTVDEQAGTARFAYRADAGYSGALVYVLNQSQGIGVITTARGDGSVAPTAPFPAAVGDEVAVTFELDAQVSSMCVRVREGALTPADEC